AVGRAKVSHTLAAPSPPPPDQGEDSKAGPKALASLRWGHPPSRQTITPSQPPPSRGRCRSVLVTKQADSLKNLSASAHCLPIHRRIPSPRRGGLGRGDHPEPITPKKQKSPLTRGFQIHIQALEKTQKSANCGAMLSA